MFALPFPGASFDVATSFNGIWKGCEAALHEARRVLTPTGKLGLTFWGRLEQLGLLPYFLKVIELSPPSHGGGDAYRGDPLRGLLGRLERHAALYNGAQLRVEIDYTVEALAPLLAQAHAERSALMQELAAEVLGFDYAPQTLYVVVRPQEPQGNWVPGAMDNLVCWSTPAGPGGPELHLVDAELSGWSAGGTDPDEFRTVFGQDPPPFSSSVWTSAGDWITDMLGYETGKVWLHWPGFQRLPRREDDPW